MITEDYVSFETAKLLKEKGFDEKCQKTYMHNGQLLWAQIFMEGESFVDNKCIELVANYDNWITHAQGEYAYLCPTIQMAMKWLREEHNLHVDSSIYIDTDGDSEHEYTYTYWDWLIFNSESGRRIAEPQIGCGRYDSYEQACEAAIKYCLKNLI